MCGEQYTNCASVYITRCVMWLYLTMLDWCRVVRHNLLPGFLVCLAYAVYGEYTRPLLRKLRG